MATTAAAVANAGAPEHLPVGTEICVHGLAARPEYNGQEGVVLSWDDAKGRVGIKLKKSGSNISLKPANVQVLASSGSVTDPELTFKAARDTYKGYGVQKDPARAAQLLRESAVQGHAQAKTMLAKQYWEGDGVPQDRLAAMKWWQAAAAQGEMLAQIALQTLGQPAADEPVSAVQAAAVQHASESVRSGSNLWEAISRAVAAVSPTLEPIAPEGTQAELEDAQAELPPALAELEGAQAELHSAIERQKKADAINDARLEAERASRPPPDTMAVPTEHAPWQDAFMAACRTGNDEWASRLLQGDAKHGTLHRAAPLDPALTEREFKRLPSAIRQTASHVKRGMPLHFAAAAGRSRVVEVMLSDAAIDVNAVHGSGGGTEEEEGETALSLAAFNGDDAVVRALLSHPGIDVSAGKPWAPLQAALIESHHGTAELLLAHPRIDANRPFRNGNGTALHHCLRSLASGYCDPGIINSLLRAKADPLSWADFGTPRGLAQEWLGHMVSTTERGPLAIAAAYPNRDISRLLRHMTDAVKMMDAQLEADAAEAKAAALEAKAAAEAKAAEAARALLAELDAEKQALI